MGTTENPQAWSTTAADNDDADAGINYKEGQDAASVNNAGRGVMTAVKNYILDTDGGLVAAGTANAITLTTNQSMEATHVVAAGATVTFRATATNTSAATVAIDSHSAVAVVDQFGGALQGGEIQSGGVHTVRYNANAGKWVLVNQAIHKPAEVLLATASLNLSGGTTFVLSSYSGYRAYEVRIAGAIMDSTAELIVRTSTDGGSSFDSGASDYSWLRQESYSAAAGASYFNDTADSGILLGDGFSTLAFDGWIRLQDPEATGRTKVLADFHVESPSGSPVRSYRYFTHGLRQSSAAVNAFRLRAVDSEAFTAGTYALVGIL